MIILVGLPGSGKSTYAKSLLDPYGHIKYLSSDKIREELYGDENIQGDPNKVFRVMHNRVKEFLDKGHDVVYDATNVTRKNRRSVINEVKKYCKEIEAHIVWAPYEDCVSRDKNRVRSVGEDVIRKFLYRWQSPYYDEGFKKIKVVHNEDIGFDINHYKNCIVDNMKIPHDNPHHKFSVYEHSLVAFEYVKSHGAPNIVQEATFFHDIGKPMTKCYKSDADGSMIPIAHYYQHDAVGGYLSYGIYSPGASGIDVTVSWLISNHMQPYFDSNYYKNMDPCYKQMLDQLHEADKAAH